MADAALSWLGTTIRGQERVGQLLDALPCGVVILRQDLQLIAGNATAARLLALPPAAFAEGTPAKEFLARLAREVDFGSADLRAVLRGALARMAEGGTATFPPFRAKDRQIAWRQAPGPAETVVLLFEDVSALAEAQQEIADRRAFLEHIFDAMPAPIFLKNAEGVYKRCNEAFAAFLGRAREAVIGRRAEEVMPAALADSLAAREQALLTDLGTDAQHVTAEIDGEIRHAIVHAATLVTPSGKIGGVFGALQDVTALKSAEAEVRAAAGRLTEIFDRSPVGVAISDRDSGEILFHNQRFHELLNVDDGADQGGLDDSLLISKRFRAGLLRELALEKALVDREQRVKLPDGSAKWFMTNIEEIPFEGRNGILWWLRDFTEQRRLTQELESQAHNDPLTGLANQTRFWRRIDRAHRLLADNDQRSALILIDLMYLRAINDRNGHRAGDHVLIEAARRLEAGLRNADVIARLSGARFGVLLTKCDDVAAVGARIEALITQLRAPIAWKDETLTIDARAAVSCFGASVTRLPELISKTELILRDALRGGEETVRTIRL